MDIMPSVPSLVEVDDLTVRFVTRETTVHAVNGVSFSVRPGEVLCILGESGSGKSVTLRAMLRLLPSRRTRIEGAIRIGDQDVLALDKRRLRDLRGGLVSMIFQEPMTALDPVYTIGQQISETVMRHKGGSRTAARARALELLDLVKIPSAERRLDNYPHELSGGLRQRAMIAMALSCGPRLLLADEPTTALDATVQIQVLILLRKLQSELGMGTIFVTHDLGVASEIADRVAVMYAGRIVEEGPVADVLRSPVHPYTQGLLASTVHGQLRDRDIDAIPGSPPDLRHLPAGCSFAPRCAAALAECRTTVPSPRFPMPDRMARCLRVADAGAMLQGLSECCARRILSDDRRQFSAIRGTTAMSTETDGEAIDFLLARAGLSPAPEQKAALRAAYPHVAAMAANVRKPRGRMAEPVLTYGFAEEDLA